jgi:hypothetical protein
VPRHIFLALEDNIGWYSLFTEPGYVDKLPCCKGGPQWSGVFLESVKRVEHAALARRC